MTQLNHRMVLLFHSWQQETLLAGLHHFTVLSGSVNVNRREICILRIAGKNKNTRMKQFSDARIHLRFNGNAYVSVAGLDIF